MPKTNRFVELFELDGKAARKCSKCGILKQLSIGFNKSKGQKFGYFAQCKQCTYEDKKANQGFLRQDLRRKYGITLERFRELSELQGNVCAICKNYCKSNERLSVDHDHETGVIRGLLCSDCNTGISLLKEDEDIFWNALEYLKRNKWKEVS